MTDTACKVAVVLTCYNEGKYIGAAVRSVLQQTRADLIESVVIADDGSDAETLSALQVLEGWDSRIRVLYGAGGAGLSAQRNLAILHTSAPILAILDGDDVWTSDKLDMQVAALTADQSVGLVYSGYFAFAWDDFSSATPAKVRDITGESDLTRAYFLNDPPIIPSTTLIRRSAFDACGGFDAKIRVFEDTDFYLRLSRFCRFAFVAAPLLYKRSNSNGITGARKDLLEHHALVAFKAASEDPRLLPLVPRRLAERARKLGNHRLLFGDVEEAKRLIQFGLRLDPLNWRAWVSFIASTRLARPAFRLLAAKAHDRRVAMGAIEPCR
jgi:glycosyltransferase involved in cell wall biosynthesis